MADDLLEQQISSEKEYKLLLGREREQWNSVIAEKERDLTELRKTIERFLLEGFRGCKPLNSGFFFSLTMSQHQSSSAPMAKPRRIFSEATKGSDLQPRQQDADESDETVRRLTAELEKYKLCICN